MLEKFLNSLHKKCGVTRNDGIILACSGGVDSMVLARLLLESRQKFAIAHCNFQLRGKDSRADQKLVECWSDKHNIPFFLKKFDMAAEKEKTGGSTQMLARALRYSWFKELLSSEGFDFIATAHHADDSIETFFINLVRGSGLPGLTGIPYKNGQIIRPLLFATKKEILAFAGENSIKWREDASNKSGKYLRNRIRNKIIPQFEKENPDFRNTVVTTLNNLVAANSSLTEYLEFLKNDAEVKKNVYSIDKIKRTGQPGVLLHYLFSDLGFTGTQFTNMVEALEKESSRFLSGDNCIIISRGQLSLKKNQGHTATYLIEKPADLAQLPFIKEFKIGEVPLKIRKEAGIAYLDLHKIKFPLSFDHWRKGDYFYPLGMKGKKLLSDFFNDIKADQLTKETQWLLRSKNQIIWVVGKRLDDRVKITSETTQVLSIEII